MAKSAEDAEDVAVKSLVLSGLVPGAGSRKRKFHKHANYYLARLQAI